VAVGEAGCGFSCPPKLPPLHHPPHLLADIPIEDDSAALVAPDTGEVNGTPVIGYLMLCEALRRFKLLPPTL